MKKVMIAAAAVAMIASAQATEIKNYNWTKVILSTEIVTNTAGEVEATNITTAITLPTTSLITYKSKKSYNKAFSLNYKDANKQFKAFKTGKYAYGMSGAMAGYVSEAVDGVIYYGTNGWKQASWTKSQYKYTWDREAPTFEVYGDDATAPTKAYAAYNEFELDNGTNMATTVYSKLKVKKGVVDQTIKSVKNLGSDKITVKNYKDAAACKKALDKLLKKYSASKATEIK